MLPPPPHTHTRLLPLWNKKKGIHSNLRPKYVTKRLAGVIRVECFNSKGILSQVNLIVSKKILSNKLFFEQTFTKYLIVSNIWSCRKRFSQIVDCQKIASVDVDEKGFLTLSFRIQNEKWTNFWFCFVQKRSYFFRKKNF